MVEGMLYILHTPVNKQEHFDGPVLHAFCAAIFDTSVKIGPKKDNRQRLNKQIF
jgi:hypothetical protein